MISMANCFQIISKGVVLFILLFSFNELFAAEGGPCKDYGECDKFQYSLNDIESLQRGASTYIIIVMDAIPSNIQDGEE